MSKLPVLRAPARRRFFSYSVIVGVLLAACQVGPAGPGAPTDAPQPSGSPSTSPTGNPTVASTPQPTPTATPTFGEGQIEHPTGATDVVLRMEEGGGFMPMEWMATQAPQFTLYGDGTVVFRPIEDPERMPIDDGLPRFLTGKMTEEGVQALLAYALDEGRLANAKEHYDNQMIADASTTVFVLNASGQQKVVSVYALFEMPDPGPDAADRRALGQLKELLMNFEREADAGTVSDIELYDAAWYRVTMFEALGDPLTEPVDWPWDDLAPADFPAGDEPGGSKMLTREQVAELVEVPSGGAMNVWAETPDGDSLVSFAVRPLLPDEVAAAEF